MLSSGTPVRTIFNLFSGSGGHAIEFAQYVSCVAMVGYVFSVASCFWSGNRSFVWTCVVCLAFVGQGFPTFRGQFAVYLHPFLTEDWFSTCLTFVVLRWGSCVKFLRLFIFCVA